MARVKYYRFDGKRVSKQHYTWLIACRADGVSFRLNSGHRTMAEQWWLYNHQPPLAAYPSKNAPHILSGRSWHALDIDTFFGDGVDAVLRWLRNQGASPTRPVPGEAWHVQISQGDLRMLYDKHKGPRPLKFGMRGEDVRRMKVKLRAVGFLKTRVSLRPNAPGAKFFGRKTRTALKQFQRSRGMKQDGIYGPNTRKALDKAYDKVKK